MILLAGLVGRRFQRRQRAGIRCCGALHQQDGDIIDNAFSVYVFHPPIVILAARILRGCTWLPILEFIILTGMGVAVTFALSAAVFRRTPILRNIL